MSDMPPFFVLTLAEEPWKKESALARFHGFGLSPTFVAGFHGMLTGLRPTNPYQFDEHGEPHYMHVAQVGCVLGHIAMLKVAIASGHPEFFACEDDVELNRTFPEQWPILRGHIPNTVNVVQLEYSKVKQGGQDTPIAQIAPGLSVSPYYAHCASCIWWRREAAIRAVQLLRPIDAPYDTMLMSKVYPFLGHALATPQLARQLTTSNAWPSSISGQTRRTDTEKTLP